MSVRAVGGFWAQWLHVAARVARVPESLMGVEAAS